MSSSTAPTSSVHISGLSPSTTQDHLTQFFSFCGSIDSIAIEGTTATVHFKKPSAAKTALFLDGGHLDGAEIKVTSDDVEAPKIATTKPVDAQTYAEKEGHDIEQEDKPHSAKLAEYLAHGYQIGDTAIAKAIEADKSYGISNRFLSFFNPLKEKAQPHVDRVVQKATEVDESKGITLKGKAALIIGSKYYSAALQSPVGAKVYGFYTQAAKTAADVHEEALRIKASRAEATSTSSSTASPTSPTAPTSSTGTAATTDTTSEKPLETTSAPLKA